MLRRVIGVIVGLTVAMLVISLVELAGQALFPPPAGVDTTQTGSIAEPMAAIPTSLQVVVVLAWTLGTLAGGVAGLLVTRWRMVPWIVAAGVIVGAVISYATIPHPPLMQAAGVALPALAAWVARRLIKPVASINA